MKNPILSILALAALTAAPATAQLSDGLVAYWPFDGDLVEATGTGADGVAELGTSPMPALYYGECKFGAVLNEQGVYLNNFLGDEQSDQYVEISGVPEDTFDFAGGSMSVSLWVNKSYLEGAGQSTLITKGGGDSWRMTWGGAAQTEATVSMFGGLGNTAATGDGSDPSQVVGEDQKHHIVGVVEAGVGIRLYFDGQLISTAAGNAQLADSTQALTIGADPTSPGTTFSENVIDDLGIWNRALNAGEIALLWNNGTGVSIGQAADDTDSDTDGIPDFYEDLNGMDKNNAADAGHGADDGLFDNDGLTNLEEYTIGTDPNNADTDGDLLKDGEEVSGSKNAFLNNVRRDPFDAMSDPPGDPTDPLNPDSDGDGLTDRLEVLGLRNVAFGRAPSDPNDVDTDDDGATDKEETDFRFDPNDPASLPPPFQIGLAGYWDFEGDLDDSSGLRRDGELLEAGVPAPIGNLKFLTNGAKTGFGTCILNDGRLPATGGPGQSIEISRSEDALDFPGGSVTVSAWVYLYAQNPDVPPSIVAKGTDNNWNLTLAPNNQARWEGGAGAISGGGNVGSPVWHHVAAVSEAGVATRLYVDGLLAAVGDAPALGRNGLPMQIGGNPEVADNTWYGLLDEVAVWGRAMDDAEVRQIWNRGDGILVSDLIAGTDTDGDGMTDSYETAHGLDPNLDDAGGDADGDTLTNKQEHDAGSDPNITDTDGDGLRDDAELSAGTSTLTPDSDGDGLTDGEEVSGSQNPYLNNVLRDPFDPMTDPPGDPTNPLAADTDGDGYSDPDEILCGTNPNDAGASCPLPYPVAYWPLDTVEGAPGPLTTPDAAHDHDFSLVNMGEGNLIEGQFGQAFSFSASAQTMLTHVGGGANALPISQYPAYTVSLWVNAVGSGQNDLRFFSEASTSTNTPLLNIGTHNGGANGSVDIYLRDSGNANGGHDQSVAQPFNGAGWRHVVLVVDTSAQSVMVYIDGEADATDFTFIDVYATSVNTTSIGGILRASPSHWVTGNIDDVAVWSTALSPEQIKALADGLINPLGQRFGEPSGPNDLRITNLARVGGTVEATTEGMDSAKSYTLLRSPDATDFSTRVGDPFSGAATHVFVDPSPPTGKAFYQVSVYNPGVGSGLEITDLSFDAGALELTAVGMDPAETYVLRRSADGKNFSTEIGTPFGGAVTHVFVDPSPPADRAFYQIWTQP